MIDDIQCVIRTSIFQDWHLISDGETDIKWNNIVRKNLLEYLTKNKINFIEEISNNEYWYTLNKTTEIPDTLYENAEKEYEHA